ncbi:hypothetical protein P170DRAFT_274923 [Aspergillus steynii IBT 23096]|uniref:Uncharacterized protein n=1 Tax=Aspergillus steynii IBT 23096 TaxID=1392250 RepID=A0A2I2FX59_9EURO|nr:uncharacterized protein P170DRAFT_274923 [Aspergillus steynii IBT 23096]PLB45193.1 hypothetical protein P170DRAFT_274923 [Aspergillus steynii IBT 23096]
MESDRVSTERCTSRWYLVQVYWRVYICLFSGSFTALFYLHSTILLQPFLLYCMPAGATVTRAAEPYRRPNLLFFFPLFFLPSSPANKSIPTCCIFNPDYSSQGYTTDLLCLCVAPLWFRMIRCQPSYRRRGSANDPKPGTIK